jgi:hypothetical protein
METGGYLEDPGEEPLVTSEQEVWWAPTNGLRAVEKRKLSMYVPGIKP